MEGLILFISLLIIAFFVTGAFKKSQNSSVAQTIGTNIATRVEASTADLLIQVNNSLSDSDVKIDELVALQTELKKLG